MLSGTSWMLPSVRLRFSCWRMPPLSYSWDEMSGSGLVNWLPRSEIDVAKYFFVTFLNLMLIALRFII